MGEIMEKFTKMKRKDLEHFLFLGNQFYNNMDAEGKAEVDFANAELERRQAKKGAKASKAEQAVLDAIRTKHDGVIGTEAAGREFNKGTLRRLKEKGLLKVENHSRLREDDREMVYWTTYKINTPLDAALSE
jgi:primosomal protein N'